MRDYKLSHDMEEQFEWRKWADAIPFINWPSTWLIKAIPPMTGAVIRYWVKLPKSKNHISIYLDCYSMLGACDKPYWEIYPNKDGDCDRFDMNNTKGLLKGIRQALMAQNKRRKETNG